MYATPKVSLQYEGKISQSFSKKLGLKQGDALNTLLFNFYINDLPNFSNKGSNTEKDQLHTPKLDNVTINNSLFADDLTRLSWSKHHLQKKISDVENYCEKWGLELNLDETKVMIFNKQGSTVKNTFTPSGIKPKRY